MSIDKEKLLDWLNEKYLDENKTHVEARPFNHVMLAIKSGKFDSNQKAITELAVKEMDALREGLTSIINMDNPIKSACIDRMHMIAKHTRTIADKIQIERLSHETNLP